MAECVYRVNASDCMDVLRRLEDGVATAVITDPPYGISYKGWAHDESNPKHASIANDDAPYIWWLREAFRMTRPGGSLCCFCRWDVSSVFETAIKAAGWKLRSEVIWDRTRHGVGDTKSQFLPQHEKFFFAVKGGGFAFRNGRPKSVICVSSVHWRRRNHPTEKPVDLMRQLVDATTSPGELVVDPFCGTGATGVACADAGRSFIGCEIRTEYCQTARARIRRDRWARSKATG